MTFGLVAAIYLSAVSGGLALAFLMAFGLLPTLISFGRKEHIRKIFLQDKLPFIFFAHHLYSIMLIYIYPGVGEYETSHGLAFERITMHFTSMLIFIVGLERAYSMSNFWEIFMRMSPYFIVALFILLSIYFFWIQGCGLSASTGSVFIPAIVFATLSSLLFSGWYRFSAVERFMCILGVSMAMIVAIGYAGRRGIFISLSVALFMLVVALRFYSLESAVPKRRWILAAGTIGLVGAIAIGEEYGCGTMFRVLSAIAPIDVGSYSPVLIGSAANASVGGVLMDPAAVGAAMPTAADESISLRLRFYMDAIKSIVENPLFGSGYFSQRSLVLSFGHQHVHNQFLSWLVTGGIIGLIFGFSFLLFPIIASVKMSAWERICISIALPGLWSCALLFDSFFEWEFFNYYYSLLSGLVTGAAKSRKLDSSDDVTTPRRHRCAKVGQ